MKLHVGRITNQELAELEAVARERGDIETAELAKLARGASANKRRVGPTSDRWAARRACAAIIAAGGAR